MKKAIIGKKLGMTQIFDASGLVIPVTVVQAGPCTVIQKKTVKKDGYEAVKVAFEEKRKSLLNKPELGAFEKIEVSPKKYIRELFIDIKKEYELGSEIKADIFNEGDIVDVQGITKGKGFTGVIKRWNFSRHNMTHGNGPNHRHVGSLGASAGMSRVIKGKKMAGHSGHEKMTIQNLKVVKVDLDRDVLLIKGAVPGPRGGLLTIRTAAKV